MIIGAGQPASVQGPVEPLLAGLGGMMASAVVLVGRKQACWLGRSAIRATFGNRTANHNHYIVQVLLSRGLMRLARVVFNL